MASDIVEKAKKRKEFLEFQIAALQAQLARISSFLKTAEELEQSFESEVYSPMGKSDKLPFFNLTRDHITVPIGNTSGPKVQRDSWVGMVVQNLKEKGKRPLKDIVADFLASDRGKSFDERQLYVTVNSALWRRKDVVGKDDDGLFLMRDDVELVDSE